MDTIIRNFFNSHLKALFEPLDEGCLELSFTDGILLRNLVVKADTINTHLEMCGIDLRVDEGRVGHMRMFYTAFTGQLSIQMQDIDIRVRPHAMKTMGRALARGIQGLMQKPYQYVEPVYMEQLPPQPVYYFPDPQTETMIEVLPSNPLYCDIDSVCCFGNSIHKRKKGPRSLPQQFPLPPPTGLMLHHHPLGRRAHKVKHMPPPQRHNSNNYSPCLRCATKTEDKMLRQRNMAQTQHVALPHSSYGVYNYTDTISILPKCAQFDVQQPEIVPEPWPPDICTNESQLVLLEKTKMQPNERNMVFSLESKTILEEVDKELRRRNLLHEKVLKRIQTAREAITIVLKESEDHSPSICPSET